MQASNKVLSWPCWIIMGRRSFCTIWAAPSCCRTSLESSSWRKYLIKSFTLSAIQRQRRSRVVQTSVPLPHPWGGRKDFITDTYLNNLLLCGRRLPPESQERCMLLKARNSSWFALNHQDDLKVKVKSKYCLGNKCCYQKTQKKKIK